MARIKFADEKTDKGIQQVTQNRKSETKTRVTVGEVKPMIYKLISLFLLQ